MLKWKSANQGGRRDKRKRLESCCSIPDSGFSARMIFIGVVITSVLSRATSRDPWIDCGEPVSVAVHGEPIYM